MKLWIVLLILFAISMMWFMIKFFQHKSKLEREYFPDEDY